MTNPPNIMVPGTWVLLVIVVLAILIPAIIIGIKLFMGRVRWRTVATPFPFRTTGPVADEEVARALRLALAALVLVWPAEVLQRLMLREDLRIWVMPVDSWLSIGNVRVGGEQDGNLLRVDKGLTSLCHELAHFCEAKLNRVRDDAHAGWGSSRIWAADEEYRRTLGDESFR